MKINFSKILAPLLQLLLSIQAFELPLQTGLGKKCSDPSWRKVALRDNPNYSEKIANDILKKWKNKNFKEALPQWDESAYLEYWTNKDRNHGESMMYEFRYLDKLVFAECKSNNGTYLPIIEAWIQSMCNITWSPPAQDDKVDKDSVFTKKAQSYRNGEYYVDLWSGILKI